MFGTIAQRILGSNSFAMENPCLLKVVVGSAGSSAGSNVFPSESIYNEEKSIKASSLATAL